MIQDLSKIKIVSDAGKGRTFVVLFERGNYDHLAQTLAESLAAKSRSLLLECAFVSDSNWQALTNELHQQLKNLNIRQCSLVGFGPASSIIQNLCLQDLRLVRTAVLVDASFRPHPTFISRVIDRIERALPLGLPLRQRLTGFDSKPYLQRIRCPVLVVSTAQSSELSRSQSQCLAQALPTSWRTELVAEVGADELCQQVLEFQEVPARCPQKNLNEQSTLAATTVP